MAQTSNSMETSTSGLPEAIQRFDVSAIRLLNLLNCWTSSSCALAFHMPARSIDFSFNLQEFRIPSMLTTILREIGTEAWSTISKRKKPSGAGLAAEWIR